jgi:glutamate--cysteine ligase
MSNPEATDFTKLYSSKDLFSFFEKEKSCEEQIGIEVELAIVTPDTGISVPYGQINSLLRSMVEDQPSQWEPIFEGENIIQIKGADGTSISLENGGAIEYSSRPEKNLSSLIDKMNEEVSKLAARVENYGLALIAVSNMPFNKPEDTSWVPKFRGEIFRNHFASLGDAGSCGWRVMAQTLSTQVTFDYVSEEDMSRKVRAMLLASPILTAMFVNSPIEEGKVDNVLSHRVKYWLKCDSLRSGCIPPALESSFKFKDYIDWAIEVPMIFRVQNGQYLPMHGRTFSSVLADGFESSSRPTVNDWLVHLSGIITDIRLRKTIEVRSFDAPAFEYIPSIPVLLTGLIYDVDSLESICGILNGVSVIEYWQTLEHISVKGLQARYAGNLIQELAKELLRLSKKGLESRISRGLERADIVKYLEPLEEIVSSGETFSERLIQAWKGELQYSPSKFVELRKVPSSI